MAILPTPAEETSLPRPAPRTRKAERHHCGSLSDGTASTASSSSSEEATPKAKKNNSRRRQRQRTNNNNNNNKKNDTPKSGKKASNKSKKSSTDLAPEEQARYLALDCEMVGVGYAGRQSALARVSLVDWQGRVVLDEYVQPDEPVTDYRTYVSGITPQHLADATHTLVTIRPVVADLLRDRILIGHALKNDLQVLQLHHPWYDIRDTAKYEPFMQVRFDDGVLWPRKLRDLCEARQIAVIGPDGQAFQQGQHCSVLDATAALKLYQMVRTKWEKVMDYKKSKTLHILQQQMQQQQQHQSYPSSDESSLSSA